MMTMASDDDADKISLDSALRFTRTDPDAVVLSLWPSAIDEESSQISVARSYLKRSGATILYESSTDVPTKASTLLVMAMYWGEDWLQTNCWYGEQPLEELGGSRPTGSWPGAKWKKELCFRQTANGADDLARTMHVFVAKAPGDANRRGRLWSEKRPVRAAMARAAGRAGNSCMHLTDDQAGTVGAVATGGARGGGGAGFDCSASYAFACARCLLNPLALEVLAEYGTSERFAKDEDLRSSEFIEEFGKFCEWLGDRSFKDIAVDEGSGNTGVDSVIKWSRPPFWK